MKKFKGLNKLLLAGAALAGVVAPSTRAAVNIQVTGTGGLAEKFKTLDEQNTIEAEITSLVTSLTNRFTANQVSAVTMNRLGANPANPDELKQRRMVEYAMLSTFDKLSRTPIIYNGLLDHFTTTQRPLAINFYFYSTDQYGNPRYAPYSVDGDAISINIPEFVTMGKAPSIALDNGYGYVNGATETYLLSQMGLGDRHSFLNHRTPPESRVMSRCVAAFAQCLGLWIPKNCAGLEWARKFGEYNCDKGTTDAWLGTFFSRLNDSLANNLRRNNDPRLARLPEELSTFTGKAQNSMADRFSELFCETALETGLTGNGLLTTSFEEVLSDVIGWQGAYGCLHTLHYL